MAPNLCPFCLLQQANAGSFFEEAQNISVSEPF